MSITSSVTLFALCALSPFAVPSLQAAATAVDMGSAANFGVIANTAITVTGANFVSGHAGTLSGTAITGPGTLTTTGVNHGGDAVTQAAHFDLTSAYASAAAQSADFFYPAVSDLGGQTLLPGVHRGASSLAITGALTLDGGGDMNSFWVFQAVSSLTTASGSSMILTNGAKSENIFWQVGSSATLGTNSSLNGHILALTSVTMTTGADVAGGIYAINGAVTFDSNAVGVPEPTATILSVIALGLGLVRRKR